jgi:molybdopterin-containing oxidoreductase family iron-sulfur binding subunit
MKRRDFLKAVGAVSSSSLLASCGKTGESEKLISYLVPPEDGVIPGEAVYTPSTCTECPAHCGIMVKTIKGWPKKVEGIPGHPVNDGGLCVRGQASLFRLYHPDRIKTPLLRDQTGAFQPITWERAFSHMIRSINDARSRKLTNLYLSGRTTGTLSALIDLFCERLDIERVPEFEFFSHANIRQANKILFDMGDLPEYRIEDADFLLTVGADILETFVSPVSYARQFGRAIKNPRFKWSHLEPLISLTGANADERLVIRPESESSLLVYLLQKVLQGGKAPNRLPPEMIRALPPISVDEASRNTGVDPQTIDRLVHRLQEAKRPLLIAGGVSTAHADGLYVALLTGLLQWVTGMHQDVVGFSRAEEYSAVGSLKDMTNLSARLETGDIGVLFISRTNPIYHLPPSLQFKDHLRKASLRVALGDLLDETMKETDLVLPLSHGLESWGDTEPRRGMRTVLQPVVKRLHDSRSDGDILLQLIEQGTGTAVARNYEEFLHNQWRTQDGPNATEGFINEGYIEKPGFEKRPWLNKNRTVDFLARRQTPKPMDEPVLIVAPSIRTYDGRSRELLLLHEIPDPLTTITYGRWCSVSESLAEKMKLRDRDEVDLRAAGWTTRLAVKIQPGLPDGTVVVQRDMVDGPPLPSVEESAEAVHYFGGIEIQKTGASVPIPVLSGSVSQHGRGIIARDPEHQENHHRHERVSLYPEHKHKVYRWAMAIDLQRCIGCSACVAACYIENNLPVVGAKEHRIGREMSWLRIEPKYDDTGKVDFIPMLCQHCHAAPCETVCPVYAAYHNPEGLNIQVYNRCVGTRYCSNNCPYKVRRFNWFDHTWQRPLDKMLNPELFVRWRGVMEKCTFCIQRIRKARDTAKDGDRTIRDGEVTTACAQSCPTGAIVFGNFLDRKSRVYQWAHSERAYRVFEELGTESSIYYLYPLKRKVAL